MPAFKLRIVTPDRLAFDGEAESVFVRTTSGDVKILPNHAELATALGTGEAKVVSGGQTRRAALSRGMLTVVDDRVDIIAVTFEWADEIDKERARQAQLDAQTRLQELDIKDQAFVSAEAKLKRALTRQKVSE